MKRAALILVVGLAAAVAGYCTLYYCGTKEYRQMLANPVPELAWLKKEFQLGDAEFERISKLHEGYMPRCADLCRHIAQKNGELHQLLGGTNVDPKAVEQKLKEAGDMRVQCQQNMFNHFLEVSRQMPPEQGRRYLQWVQQRTLTPGHDMAQRHNSENVTDHH
jgi:Spy/CpxP family protein refolding chaperone